MNSLMYNIKRYGEKTMSRYSFADRGTDGQTDGIDFGMFSQRPFE